MSELRVGDLAWAAIPETRMVGQSSSKLTWLGGKSTFLMGNTTPETNSEFAPETPMVGSDDSFPFGTSSAFHGFKMLVSGTVSHLSHGPFSSQPC